MWLKKSFQLKNIHTKWIPEIQHHCVDTPFLLVGTKSDIIDDTTMINKLKKRGNIIVNSEDALQMGNQNGAIHVMTCSAKTQEGLKNVFDNAIRTGLVYHQRSKKKKKRKKCTLL